jgi:hypothetical protein
LTLGSLNIRFSKQNGWTDSIPTKNIEIDLEEKSHGIVVKPLWQACLPPRPNA